MSNLAGIGVALVTPFKNGKVDFEGYARLLEFVRPHVDYYVVMGTTGESPTATTEEKKQLLQYCLKHAKGLPIVYGIGGNNTSNVIAEIKTTDLKGVDSILSICPYYSKPSQRGLIAHYNAIADVSPCPIILYNVPARTGSNLEATTTLKLSKHPNICAVKEASGDLDQIQQIIDNSGNDFGMISGDDLLTPKILELGGIGVISVLANGIPGHFKAYFDGVIDSKSDEAIKSLNPLMYEEGNPVGVKELLKIRGICENEVRMPHIPASQSLAERIRLAFEKLDLN